MSETQCPVCGSPSFDVVERNVGYMYWKVRNGVLVDLIGKETASNCEEVFCTCADCHHVWSLPEGMEQAADLFPEIETAV